MKTSAKWIAPLIAVALLSACGKGPDTASNGAGSAQPIAAPAGTDWVTTVEKTQDFGYRMGNPDAPVKLIEYGAFSCPGCAAFSKASDEGLKALVAKGTVSFELRPFLIHSQDLSASLLAGCNGPGPFFTIADQLFARQESWLANTSTLTEGMVAAWQAQGEDVYATQMAQHLGLPEFVAPLGISADKAKACLADKKLIGEFRELMKVASEKYQVTGTPTFVINGNKVDVGGSWTALEAALKAAGA